ncbi:Uncharacterized protein BP5553_08075 [Venustampulla echinocandica]|uniref:AB hydrolase-1 domain-containing protein n=1 Tax=Venustampulla echinocandica TaxID=2656787 RepID=A0A370TFN6_9HELO|nr:Uncharacterized protein BP5553_08075 [Venustampulla echinocandica]RDL33707.1 Uncharacterized protein BP5553_08075 [Venustampulla echinocandica]
MLLRKIPRRKLRGQTWRSTMVPRATSSTLPRGALIAFHIPQPLGHLTLERNTDTALFSVPPATALSRIVYQSKTLSGSLVPVSAYVLRPLSPRAGSDGYQIVAWAHGTSGSAPNCAPSHIKNLWQHFLAPYQLALQGYVVVATDYAGLGVSKDASDIAILHEYLVGPSHANGLFYSVEAAQAAFPELSASFVIAGHSQGGGAAWAAAQRQAVDPVSGYLGAVALAPITTVIDQSEPTLSIIGLAMTPVIEATFPELKRTDILTPDAVERLALARQIGGCSTTSLTVLMGVQLMQPDWLENPFVRKFQALIANGGIAIAEPLLVIHGEGDPQLNVNMTTAAIERTAAEFPRAKIEYIRVPGMSHNGCMPGSQWLWMDWIANRFAGIEQKPGLKSWTLSVAMPNSSYQRELNWSVAPATKFYETP